LHVQTDEPARFPLDGVPGVRTGRRMSRVADYTYAAPGGLDALVVGEFETAADAVKAAGTLGAGTGRQPVANVFRQISPASGWLTVRGVESGPQRPAGTTVLSVVMDVDADALIAFHGWYEEEHLPKLVAVPGILCAVRYQALTIDEAPATAHPPGRRVRFLAWYEMAEPGVVATDAFAAASVLTPRTAEVTARLAWASQLYVER
jgi:hypothetical protein